MTISTHRSILSQAKYRFAFSFLIFGLLSILVGYFLYQVANSGAVDIQRINASQHYTKVMADLERRWGRAAFNFKIRLESENFFNKSLNDNDRILAYLTAQGGSTEFPSLRIENLNGEKVFSYEYVADSSPKVLFLPGQETAWVLNSTKNKLFLVIRQLIWLGKENGYLLLFHPMDNSLLNQISYPNTQLSLWWNDKSVASSDGELGLSRAALSVDKVGKENSVFFISWAGIESAKTPKILVESTLQPLINFNQIALALIAILVTFVISCWFVFGDWWLRIIRRIQALDRAQVKFQSCNAVDASVVDELVVAHAYQDDEISSLSIGAEKIMRHAAKDES